MRRVANELGSGVMSLYKHVPGKPGLLDVMVDRASAEITPVAAAGSTTRERLEHVARSNRALFERHPWLLDLRPGRPPQGPGVIEKYDIELHALDGTGLGHVDRDSVPATVLQYVRGATATVIGSRAVATGDSSDDQWWSAVSPVLLENLDQQRHALAVRVGTAVVDHDHGTHNAERWFKFGLSRVLDGIETFLHGSRPPTATRSDPRTTPPNATTQPTEPPAC